MVHANSRPEAVNLCPLVHTNARSEPCGNTVAPVSRLDGKARAVERFQNQGSKSRKDSKMAFLRILKSKATECRLAVTAASLAKAFFSLSASRVVGQAACSALPARIIVSCHKQQFGRPHQVVIGDQDHTACNGQRSHQMAGICPLEMLPAIGRRWNID